MDEQAKKGEPVSRESTTPTPPPAPVSRGRLVALAVLLVGFFVVGWATGWTDRLSLEAVRATMASAGAWGFVLFLVAFVVGELVHVPGVVFLAAAVLAYGRLVGFGAAYLGAILSVVVSFLVVRAVGGRPLGALSHPRALRVLAHLEQRPVLVISALRLVLWMAPALNYALALSPVRLRDYVIGSVLGLLFPLALASFFIEWVVKTFL